MKSFITSVLCCLCTFILQAQIPSINERPPLETDAPDWVKEMYADKPNVHQVDSLFEAFYAKNPKIRNNYIRFYERWHRAAVTRMQPDGFIDIEDLERKGANTTVEQTARDRKTGEVQTRAAANWTSFGPHQTYSPGSVVRTYHTNIYSLDIADTDPNTLYAGGENSGAWKTTDKGATWTSIGDNFPNEATSAIEIHPTDPNIVYACSDRYVHKTTDGGTTWTTKFNVNLGIDDIQIHKTNPNILVIGGDGGMRRTTDGGATLNTSWATVAGMTTWISDIEVNPTANNEWYCLRKNTATNLMEFYKSIDAGATWSIRNVGWVAGTTDEGGRMCVTPANDARIYVVLLSVAGPIMMRSDDKGESWTVLVANLGGMDNGNGYYDLSIAASHTNADWVFAGTTGSYRSVDAGVTWTFVGNSYNGITLHTDLQEVKCVGNDTWTATDGGISLSTDFFATQGNFSPRNKNINGFATWGFGQGWQEDVIALSGYHNGTKAMSANYAAGDNLRIDGGEPATGYVMHGREQVISFSNEGVLKIPTSIAGSFTNLTNLGKYPNEDDYGSSVSEIEFHPNCFNTMYLGKDNAFWKSTDGGVTFAQLYDFGVKPRHFEISRSNPSVMYLATTAAFYRSTNGGTVWTAVALPAGCSIYRLSISLSFTDENTLWITSESNGNGNKIFKSINGGASWTNLSTATLNGFSFNQVVHQQGTNGGVYLIGNTGGKVFYGNNTHTDWQDYSTSLPAHFENLRAIPFYRNGKIRMGGTRGVWETDFFEPSTPVAQPTVDKQTSVCPRDTFYFDDYSVVKYSEATWSWNFTPAPAYISSTTVRNPKVVFGSTGTYSYTVTVTDGAGNSTKTVTNEIQILTNECGVDTLPGNSLTLPTTSDYVKQNKAIGITTNTMTISCWIKPSGIQANGAGIVFSASGGACGFNFMSNNQIGYHWANDGGTYNWTSGPTIPADEWSHVAWVVNSTSSIIYWNGVPYTRTAAHNAVIFNQIFQLGRDRTNTGRNFKGEMDEVCIYSRALSQNEIRELMHLTRNNPNAGMPATDATLISYYQFNESAGNPTFDRAKDNHLTFIGGVSKANPSTAPVGGGSAFRMTVNSGGVKDFTGTNCQIEFPASGTYPNGELVVTALNTAPNQTPPTGTPLSNKYFIVNNYGTNTFTTLSSMRFSNLGNFAIGAANNFKLYKRPSNATTPWGASIDAADVLTTANNNTLTFSTNNGITSFSQFMLTKEAVLAVELLDFKAVLNNKTVEVSWHVADEKKVKQYIIERSNDGRAFAALAQQSNTQSSKYTTQDDTPQYGANYYRLKIVETDGSIQYSPIRTVIVEDNKVDYKVYPNPTADILNIQFVSNAAQTTQFDMFDAVGRLIYSHTTKAQEGNNHLFIKTKQFGAGVYTLSIKQNQVVTVKKVVIE
jgi:photosystem II stability/assembly factor-like uncharacterized protein